MRSLILAAAAAFYAAPALACIDVSKQSTTAEFTGVLERKVFPGPPEFSSVEKGDTPLVTYILRLPKKVCAAGSGADPKKLFDNIHVSSRTDAAWPWLSSHVGQRITVGGEIFPAFTAWHMAPLVMLLPKDWAPDGVDDDTELHR